MRKKPAHPASIRNKNVTNIKQVIDAMLKSYNLDKRFDQKNLALSWGKIMGKVIAKRTSKMEVRNNVLIVSLNSAPLKHELNNSREKVRHLIEKEFGKGIIKDVLFI